MKILMQFLKGRALAKKQKKFEHVTKPKGPSFLDQIKLSANLTWSADEKVIRGLIVGAGMDIFGFAKKYDLFPFHFDILEAIKDVRKRGYPDLAIYLAIKQMANVQLVTPASYGHHGVDYPFPMVTIYIDALEDERTVRALLSGQQEGQISYTIMVNGKPKDVRRSVKSW